MSENLFGFKLNLPVSHLDSDFGLGVKDQLDILTAKARFLNKPGGSNFFTESILDDLVLVSRISGIKT